MDGISRRTVVVGFATGGIKSDGAAQTPSKIIDTHVHFYDPNRVQGVLWPPKNDQVLYRRVLPDELEALVKPLGVTGAVVVEASPDVADNDWVLQLIERDPFVLGMVGHLDPGAPDFAAMLERYQKNRRFRGIRRGNLWNADLDQDSDNPKFIAGLKLLAQAGLELDTANPNPKLVRAVLKASNRVPNLRIVMDHFPIDPPRSGQNASAFETDLRELAQRQNVYLKVSGVLRRSGGRTLQDAGFYKPALDQLWELFGEDRLIYGSNWPVSNLIAPYTMVLKVVRDYFTAKGVMASEKYFWRNAVRVYGL